MCAHTPHGDGRFVAMTGSKHMEALMVITGGCSSLLHSHGENHMTPNSKKLLPNNTTPHQHQVILVRGRLLATRIHINGIFLF